MTAEPKTPFYLDETDELDELVSEWSKRNPQFPELYRAAQERRALMRAIAAQRRRLGISQVEVARRMQTSQAFVSRLERGMVDPQHGTEDRYASVLGVRIERRIVATV